MKFLFFRVFKNMLYYSLIFDNVNVCLLHIKKQRHHFVDRDSYSQSYGFSSNHVRMWELVHKKTECQRIDALELWCWRTLLRVRWTARSNQSVLKEIKPEYSLEGLMLKLKLTLWLLDAKS